MTELTDAECDAFRALPLDFNGMVRAIYAAGAARSADTSGARWLPIETAPQQDDHSFLVRRDVGRGMTFTMQVSRFEGNMYPDHLDANVDWEDQVNDATHWMPLPEPPPAAPGGPAGARRQDDQERDDA